MDPVVSDPRYVTTHRVDLQQLTKKQGGSGVIPAS
jgi:hypothetical protein